jgi:hypothetical protein
MNATGLDDGAAAEWWQDACEALGQHGLPRAGWTRHQEVMAAGGGHFQRPSPDDLTPDLGQVRRRPLLPAGEPG